MLMIDYTKDAVARSHVVAFVFVLDGLGVLVLCGFRAPFGGRRGRPLPRALYRL